MSVPATPDAAGPERAGGAQRPMTPEEMRAAEAEASRSCRVFLAAYLAFPTAENFDLLTVRMRAYQTAWMNGRQREGLQ